MTMRLIKIVLFTSLLLQIGMADARTVPQTPQSQNATAPLSPAIQINGRQTHMEQAADHFNAFARQIPSVIAAKLNAFRQRGFKAVLLDDPETKPAEEAMIDSLVKGLQALGNALLEDLETAFAVRQEPAPPVSNAPMPLPRPAKERSLPVFIASNY